MRYIRKSSSSAILPGKCSNIISPLDYLLALTSPTISLLLLFLFLSICCLSYALSGLPWSISHYLLIIVRISSTLVCSFIHVACFSSLHIMPSTFLSIILLAFFSSILLRHAELLNHMLELTRYTDYKLFSSQRRVDCCS